MPINVSGPRPGPYDPGATASKCLRLDAGPRYLPQSHQFPPAMLLMILEQDLRLDSKVHSPTKRVKKNDGGFEAVDFQRGDYRIVLWAPPHEGNPNKHQYFYTIREYIQSQIDGFDKLLGIQRAKVKMRGERNYPGKFADSGGETEDDEGDGENDDSEGEREENEEDRSGSENDGEDENMNRPACWYVFYLSHILFELSLP